MVGRAKPLSQSQAGANSAFEMDLAYEGRTEHVIFKPAMGEREGLRRFIDAGTYHRREAAASELDEALGGVRVVPKTVSRKVKGRGIGSAQHWAKGAKDYVGLSDAETTALVSENLAANPTFRKTFLLDVVTCNTDRHSGNYMLKAAKKLPGKQKAIAIDNGLTLPKRWNDFEAMRFPDFLADESIMNHFVRLDADSISNLKRLTQRKMAKILAERGIERSAAQAAMVRVEALKYNPNMIEAMVVHAPRRVKSVNQVQVFVMQSYKKPRMLVPHGTLEKIEKTLDAAYKAMR
jgi:hypothetical protein